MTTTDTKKTIAEATHEEIEAAAFAAIDALTKDELLRFNRNGGAIVFDPKNADYVSFIFCNPIDGVFRQWEYGNGAGFVLIKYIQCGDDRYTPLFSKGAKIREMMKDMIDPAAIQEMAAELQGDED